MAGFDLSKRETREELTHRFFEGTGSSYDRVVAITTFGLDKRWKRRLLAHVPEEATAVLDLACGTGIVTTQIHEKVPQARIVGVDFTEEYLDVARTKFADIEADVTFVHSNAETMELDGRFDAVISSYLPKYVNPDALLERLEGHIEPGGIVALHDFDHPRVLIPRSHWRAHMWFLRVVGRLVFPAWNECLDRDLEVLIRESHWVRRYREALWRHGFEEVRRERLHYGTAAIVSARKPR